MRARKRIVDPLTKGKKKSAPKKSKQKAAELSSFNEEDTLKDILKTPCIQHHREGDCLHVSDLIGKCVRKIALSKRTGIPMKPEPLFDGQKITFAQGDAIHDHITDKVIKACPDKVFASWTCICGKLRVPNTTYDKAQEVKKCKKCGRKATTHKELSLRDDELMLTGHVDLSLLFCNNLQLNELKSIKKSRWDDLVSPLPDHVIQVLLYWYLARRQEIKLVDKVTLLYAAKEYMMSNPYKEFHIRPSEQLHRLDDYLEDVRAYAASLKGGGLPIRTVCKDITSPAAKKCQFKSICFQV